MEIPITRPPEPLEQLIQTISDCLEAHSEMRLGFRYWEEDDVTQLMVHPLSVELIGGADDGSILLPGFSLDIHSLAIAFDQIHAIYWISQGFTPSDPEGAHLSIEGHYHGKSMWIRIMAAAPNDEAPGMKTEAI